MLEPNSGSYFIAQENILPSPSPSSSFQSSNIGGCFGGIANRTTAAPKRHNNKMQAASEKSTPVFGDPVSAFTYYMNTTGEKIAEIIFDDVSTKQNPCFEAKYICDGVTYKGTGASKKEAKQRMAVVVLRDKFSLDASELLNQYLHHSVGAKKSKLNTDAVNTTMEAKPSFALNLKQQQSASFADDFDLNWMPKSSPQSSQPYLQNMSMHRRLGGYVDVGLSSSENIHDAQTRTHPSSVQRMSQGVAPSGFCTQADLRALLQENSQLRAENEMLKLKLRQLPVHARLGEKPAVMNRGLITPIGGADSSLTTSSLNIYEDCVNNQPQFETVATAQEQLMELRNAHKGEMTVSLRRCDTTLLGNCKDHYALVVVKLKAAVCLYKFYGKGATKKDALLAASSIALDFIKRVLVGEKLIPFHVLLVAFLFQVMTNAGIEKPSDMVKVETDVASGKSTATMTLGDVQFSEVGQNKKAAREKLAGRVLEEVYGYVPYAN